MRSNGESNESTLNEKGDQAGVGTTEVPKYSKDGLGTILWKSLLRKIKQNQLSLSLKSFINDLSDELRHRRQLMTIRKGPKITFCICTLKHQESFDS